MKALVQAYLFLTASAGHVIVIVAVLKVDPKNLAFQAALFGGIVLADIVLFTQHGHLLLRVTEGPHRWRGEGK